MVLKGVAEDGVSPIVGEWWGCVLLDLYVLFLFHS